MNQEKTGHNFLPIWLKSLASKPTHKSILDALSLVVLLFLSTLLLMMISGSRFSGFLSRLNLYNEKQGLYVDCLRSGTQTQRFCQPRPTRYDKEWNQIGDRVPFSLSGN